MRFFGLLARIPMWLACGTLFCLMVMTFFDVVLRSLFNAPIEAATELTRMALALVVFAVMPLVSFRGQQISVDLLDGFFTRFKIARWRDVLISLGCGVMLFWPAERVSVLAERARSYGDTTEYLHIPVFYLSWTIAALTLTTGLSLIARALILAVKPTLIGVSYARSSTTSKQA